MLVSQGFRQIFEKCLSVSMRTHVPRAAAA